MSERGEVFAQTSSALLSRLLMIKYISSQDPDKCLLAIDFSDAFLTVTQTVPTKVVYKPADGGPEVEFALGRVLPGQGFRV